ncbi:MAG TPA: type VI secretion system tip protein TssI/VgrG [Sandaracinaceae bacterium LLY-WYZ-13_1]|nr:type VI secretion system tip protein TssI/VgrG [Sandaracinaceae bacterium LLY-WYZ-13_1]
MSATPVVKYHFETAAFAGVPMPVRHVRVSEQLDEPYVAAISIELPDETADPNLLLGQNVTLVLTRGSSERRFVGLVERLTYDGPWVELTVVPALRLLDRERDSRIFQEKTVPEILEEVLNEALGPYGREATLELEGSYPTREYCVQYQETNLDFVQRLMQAEGIHYTFEHEGEVEVMVLRDRNQAYPELASGAEVPYVHDNLEIVGDEPVHRFARFHRPAVSKVTVRDWDWTRGGDMVVASDTGVEAADGRERESYEHGEGRSLSIWSYDQGVRRYQEEDAAPQAATRLEAQAEEVVVGEGVGRAVAMAPGVTFELTNHPTVGMDGTYLVTRVEHNSRGVEEAVPGFGSTEPYYNRFECIPVDTPHRPRRRAAKPIIAGVQTAVVTGPAGEEIHVDEHGRIKVQFHWDRVGQLDERTTCWIRVQQPWAGAGWGFWWVPRIGMEAVVHFVDGDPDRPLVTGSVYDAANPLPYGLPDEKTKSTIKSNSSLGGGGFNEFRFEDAAGSEEIYTHAQKDYNEVVENDHTTHVKHDQANTVDNDQTQEVGNDQMETVHGNQQMTVDANRTVHVKGNYDETVDGTETRTTTGDVSETFGSNETRDVSGNLDETIGGDETRDIGANQTETISGNQAVSISGSSTDTISGALTETVAGGITTETPQSYDITAAAGFTVAAPAGISITATGGMTILAPGGVVNADSFFKWNGGAQMAVGGLEYKAVGLKIGLDLTAFGVTSMKLEDDLVKQGNEALEVWSKALDVNQKGMELQISGLRLGNIFNIKT